MSTDLDSGAAAFVKLETAETEVVSPVEHDRRKTPVSSASARVVSRVFDSVAIAVVLGIPLVIAPGFSFYFDVTPKVLLLLLGAAFLLFLPAAWAGGLPVLWRDRFGRWLIVLLLAQGLWLVVATCFSSQPALSVSGSNWRRLGLVSQSGLLVFTVVTAGRLAWRPAALTTLLRAVTIGGSGVALYGVLQYFGIDPFLPSEAYHVGEGYWQIVRPPGTLGHAGYLATYLAQVVFLALGVARTDASARWRTFGSIAAGLASAAIVLGGTRSAMLALVVGGVLLSLWYRPRLSRRWLTAAVLVAVTGVAFYYSPLGRQMRARTRWYIEDPRGGARLWLWRDAVRMSRDHWLVGTGPETFSPEFPRYQSVELARAFPNRYHESPHNVFLDALTSQGLPGLLVFVGLVTVAFAAGWRRGGERAGLAGYLAGSLTAGLTSGQFLVFTLPTALYCYFTLAAVVAIGARSAGGDWRAPRRWGLLRWAGVPAGLAFLVFAVRLGMADWGMVRIQRHAEAGETAAAMAGYERVRGIKPAGMYIDLWYSRLMASLAQQTKDAPKALLAWQAAGQAAERAVVRSEDLHNALYNLARFYSARNDFPGTEATLRRAISIAPNWYVPHFMLAQVLGEAGRIAEARKEAELAVDLTAGRDEEVTSTWKELQAIEDDTEIRDRDRGGASPSWLGRNALLRLPQLE